MLAITLKALSRKDGWMDGIGLGLAGLCFVHCIATSVILALVASAGGVLFSPVIHEIGLALAILFGAFALCKGVLDHGFLLPASIGAVGIGIMCGALTLDHGGPEILWTMVGVAILALGHDLNYRANH